MNRLQYAFSFLLIATNIDAQQFYIDSLRREAHHTQNDSARLVIFRNIAREFAETHPDSAYHYAAEALQLSRRLHLALEEGSALWEMAYALSNKGEYPRSLQVGLSALTILEDSKSERTPLIGRFTGDNELVYRKGDPHQQRLSELGSTHQILGNLYSSTKNYEKALVHHRLAKQNAEASGNIYLQSVISLALGNVYLNLGKADSALISERHAYNLVMTIEDKKYLGSILLNMGRIYEKKGKKDSAIYYYRQALDTCKKYNYNRGVVATYLELADMLKEMGRPDSSLYYLRNALTTALELDAPEPVLRSYTKLADYFKSMGDNDSTVAYQSLIIKLNDTLFNSKRVREFQNIEFDEQQRQSQIEAAKTEYRQKLGTYALLAGLAIFLFISFVLWRSSNQRKLANIRLSSQKKELQSTLETLKATQNQLIQSEKMASLGELTAGIAHEIQNPLNFVNNFSEVNKELIDEMNAEINKGNYEYVKSIAKDIENNEDKINSHGKRAEAIVKGMLQHSRTSSGQKEPTDINAMAGEYLRLAYHGLRAKDKSFNAKIQTDLDAGIDKVNAIPQDIGRVLVNLINNAFYAVNEKKKTVIEGYEPTVSVSTRKIGNMIELIVKDNGTGIHQKTLDKIFQPFFTTKPAGQGTGLGLSLAYDIVKAHGGEIQVSSKENYGTEFTMVLPS